MYSYDNLIHMSILIDDLNNLHSIRQLIIDLNQSFEVVKFQVKDTFLEPFC